jgi:hypothetical protein
MLKRKKKKRKKKEKKKKLPRIGFEPTPLSSNAVDRNPSLFEYLSKRR